MNLVDLFSGCGGFSLGAHQAGFQVAAAFDNDSILSSSYSLNFPSSRLVKKDIRKVTADDLLAATGGLVDGIFGGPPCQGFSDIGKRQLNDPRRQLVGHFFRIVSEAEPSFFVMENVRGLAYADARGILDRAVKRVSDRYSVLEPLILDSSEFGAATKRSRLFLIGIHKDRADPLELRDIERYRTEPATVATAIADLKGAISVGENDGFDVWRITRPGRPSQYASKLRNDDGLFTGQRFTAHTKEVVKRFRTIPQGAMDPIGRHPRLSWAGQCPTLRAGTGSDKGSFQSVRPLHPDEPRVITVREAARLQGFPDKHLFHPTIWHSFRMIGNSVSPIMSHAIFSAIRDRMGSERNYALAAE